MLFDLRSRGRRRTVQAVYLTLAILMGGGLVLFGVGTGSGIGGLLNAFTGSGSNQQTQVLSQQEKAALKATKADPSSAAAWASLVNARYANASSTGYDSTTATYTAAGKKELTAATQDWQRYLTLTKTPDPNVAIIAARAYAQLAQYSGAAGAWQIEAAATPSEVKGYECLAVSAYAAGDTRVGTLAEAKALTMTPKAERSTLKSEIEAAKTQPTVAQSC
jgi:predicted Zn-dependent protease